MADNTNIKTRVPIVAVMGHVDHGKTSLLDFIRNSSVAAKEHGGITQHLGAYQVETKEGKKITFLDTPGHAAFEGIRRRGGEVADIVILVVAADDGVKPQTIEAIKHIKNSGVPMIVAFNKTDLEDANVDHVKQQLSENEILVESYGGDVVSVEVSAKTGKGVPELLEMIGLVSDILELKADYSANVIAVCIESRMDKAGPVASLLVKQGTLKLGMDIKVEDKIGRVRNLRNDKNENVKEAVPSVAVEVVGMPIVPAAGSIFIEENGSLVTSENTDALNVRHMSTVSGSLSDLFGSVKSEDQYPIIIRADVAGSLEAVTTNLPDPEHVFIIDKGIGDVTEADVLKAHSSGASIYAFNVGVSGRVKKLAELEKVEINSYKIIYKLFEDMSVQMEKYLAKEETETITGRGVILKVFDGTVSKIAGVKVQEGVMPQNGTVRILRNGEEVGKAKIVTVHRVKETAQRLSVGQEGGLTFDTVIDFAEGDIVEYYRLINR